jgi:HTH-type transcriptional regulator, sugar sensing transcriptional regulator
MFDDIDISDREFKIYESLLSMGSGSIREIATDASINRGSTHEILKNLIKKGLASYQLKGTRRHYLAESPDKLLYIAEEKKNNISKLQKKIKEEITPGLYSQKNVHKDPSARYYEGEEGIEKVLKDVLQTVGGLEKKIYYTYSALQLRKYLYRLFPSYTTQRIKNTIRVKVISLGKGGEEAELAQRKWLPVKKSTTFTSYEIIYGDKFAIVSLAENEVPYAVVINEPGIAQTQKLIFETLWELL